MQHRILVVEDEEDLLKGLELRLRKEGYEVLKATRGDQAIRTTLKDNPHLIVLDLMLPGGMSGFDVCRELRQKGIEVPIIMLTAKAEEIDRVLGLEIGADDYVTKPFSVRELLARIRVQLRRQPAATGPALTRYRVGSVDVDFEKMSALRNGQPVDMTPREFEVLRLLVRHRGEVVSRDRMLTEVWGYDDASPTTRTIDTHILKLRQKLEADPANPRLILSIYGEGYKFVG